MALPASAPITLQQIQDEFGAPRGTPLSAFLRGGAWVPNSAPNAGVPTALPINMLQLLGATNIPPVVLTSRFISSLRVGAGAITSEIEIGGDGIVRINKQPGTSVPISGEWLTAGSPSAYEVRGTWTSSLGGAGSRSGTVGVWIPGNTGAAWRLTNGAGVGSCDTQVTIEIRPAGGGANVASAVYDLYTERS